MIPFRDCQTGLLEGTVLKDVLYDDHTTEWLQDSDHAAGHLTGSLEEGDCDTLVVALERVLKARAESADLPLDGLEAVCRLKPLLDGLSLHLAVAAR